jgi:hypothetical protein
VESTPVEIVVVVETEGVTVEETFVPELVKPAELVALTVNVYDVGITPVVVTVPAKEPEQTAVVPVTTALKPVTAGLTVTA